MAKRTSSGYVPMIGPVLVLDRYPGIYDAKVRTSTIDKPYLAYRPFERASNTNSAFSDVNGLRVELETI